MSAGSSKRLRVGLFMYGISYPYQNELLIGAHEELAAHDADLYCLSGSGFGLALPDEQRDSIYELVGPGDLDAIIAATGTFGGSLNDRQLVAFFQRFQPTPCCSIGYPLADVPSIAVDNSRSVRELTLHLIDVHSRQRIAFVGPRHGREAEQRFSGYVDALGRRGMPLEPSLVIDGNFTRDSGIAAAQHLVGPDGPLADAVVAANDWTAIGLLEALDRAGVDVPGQVAVVGFDDIDEARFTMPPLSTIVQPIRRLGTEAAKLALAQAVGAPVAARLDLPTSVRLRRSCGCFDQTRAEAARPSGRPLSPAELLDPSRLEREIALAAAELDSAAAGDWAPALVRAFLADLAAGGGDRFLTALSDLLKRTAHLGNVGVWQSVVAALRAASYPGWPDAGHRFEVERIFHRAHVLVGESAERAQGRRRIEEHNAVLALQHLTTALRTALDRPAIAAALNEHLSSIGIPACYVGLQPAHFAAVEEAQMILALDRERGDSLSGRELPFRAGRIIPDQLLPPRRFTVIVEALMLAGGSVGFSVLEFGPYNGAVYSALHERLAAALRAAWLFESVVQETTKRERAERARLESEVQIATRIQTGILPRTREVPGLELAAVMVPATEVGGDYFDVLPFDGGAWFGIGDVAGHGLHTGLVMVMIQSIVAATTRCRANASPAEIWTTVNSVLYQNVRERLEQDEHATLTLLRYQTGGKLAFAGAHEDLLLYRADSGRTELIPSPGIWAGIVREPRGEIPQGETELRPGDVLLLYTDGVTEARSEHGELFGLERLCARLVELAREPIDVIRDGLLETVQTWRAERDDDLTLFAIRRRS